MKIRNEMSISRATLQLLEITSENVGTVPALSGEAVFESCDALPFTAPKLRTAA